MGRGQGRPSTPTNLKVLHGTRPDRVNHREPKPASVPAATPAHLTDAALAVWTRLAPDLEAKQVLTSWDVDEFGVFCEATALHQIAYSQIGDAAVVKGSKGPAKNPWFQIWRDTADVMVRYGARFGLSPSDRANLSTEEPPDDEREALLG